MTNQELVVELAKRMQLTQKEISEMLECTVKIITHSLENEKSINVQGFGLIERKKREGRISVNPLSQKRYIIPPKFSVAFKPGQNIKDNLKKMTVIE